MKLQPIRRAVAPLAGLLLLLCAACASTEPGSDQPGAQSVAAPLRARYAQVSFGKDARFALCVEPACPKVTPKTLAAEQAADAVRAVDASSTAGANEMLLRARAAASRAASIAGLQRRGEVRARDRVVIHFPKGSADMTAEAKRVVAQVLPRTNPPRKIVIAGLGDAAGRPKANDPLMLRRAMAVRSYVVDAAPRLAGSVSIDANGTCCVGTGSGAIKKAGSPEAAEVEIVFTSLGAAQ